jgi:hypothetical protein
MDAPNEQADSLIWRVKQLAQETHDRLKAVEQAISQSQLRIEKAKRLTRVLARPNTATN